MKKFLFALLILFPVFLRASGTTAVYADPGTGSLLYPLNFNLSPIGVWGSPVNAPGLVVLSDAGSGTLTGGTYFVAVCAVDAFGVEGQMDNRGYYQADSIALSASHNLTVTWPAVPGASLYHVYVYNSGSAAYYQRYYQASSSPITISVEPVGPTGTVTVTPHNTGGTLADGNYYFAVNAVFSNGMTVDQTVVGTYVAGLRQGTNTASYDLSWSAVNGATGYRVFVVNETNGTPRTHTQYFTTGSNSVTVTGSETYIAGPGSLINGNRDSAQSGAVIGTSFQGTGNARSMFGGDIMIVGFSGADAVFQSNRFNINSGFGGLDIRDASVLKWRAGIDTSSDNFVIQNGSVVNDMTIDMSTDVVSFPNTSGKAMTNGVGGTGSATAEMNFNGGSASGGGPIVRLQRNGSTQGLISLESSAESNTSNDLHLEAGSGNAIRLYANGSQVATVSSNGISQSASGNQTLFVSSTSGTTNAARISFLNTAQNWYWGIPSGATDGVYLVDVTNSKTVMQVTPNTGLFRFNQYGTGILSSDSSGNITSTARTINGTTFDGSGNITVAAAANTLTGTTLASGVVTSSLTSVGAVTSTDATTPSFTTQAGSTNTGFLLINGKTSGSTKFTTADATSHALTVSTAAQPTGDATLTIPDLGGGAQSVVITTAAQTLTNKTLTSPVINGATSSGSTSIDFSGNSGTFKSTTGANTLGGATAVNGLLTSQIQVTSNFLGASAAGVFAKETDDASGGNFFDCRNGSGSNIGGIARVTTTNAVAFNTTSDARLKSPLRSWSLGDSFDKIPIGEFNWIDGNVIGHGTIAQELFKIFPDAVTVGGEDPKNKPWQVDYGRLVIPTIVRVKEADARIASLEEARECRISNLEIRCFEIIACFALALGLLANFRRK